MCNACKTVSSPLTDQFSERLLGTLNEAGVALMISIGHRAGLFDAMAGRAPGSSAEIAADAGLEERYVREWLGAMVTGRIVEHDPSEGTYRLPDEHAAVLTRAATPSFGPTFQWIAVLADVECDIVDAFRNGGGVPYERYTRFHEVMAEESAQTVVAGLIDDVLPLVPGLTEQLEQGIDVLDVGCGSGRALCALAEHFPRSRFTGFDLCEDAVVAARAEASRRGLPNVSFEVRDVSALGRRDHYDLVTAFDIVHDQRDPDAVLDQIRASLKPGGTFLMQDIRASSSVEKNLDHPLGPFLYTISTMHCMTVSLAQGGAGLGTVWGEELALRMLDQAGFDQVEVKQLPNDIMNNWYVTRRA